MENIDLENGVFATMEGASVCAANEAELLPENGEKRLKEAMKEQKPKGDDKRLKEVMEEENPETAVKPEIDKEKNAAKADFNKLVESYEAKGFDRISATVQARKENPELYAKAFTK